MRKPIQLTIILVLLTLLAACATVPAAPPADNQAAAPAEEAAKETVEEMTDASNDASKAEATADGSVTATDMLGRTVTLPEPAERIVTLYSEPYAQILALGLPVGAVTALLGAPFFLYLLLRGRSAL